MIRRTKPALKNWPLLIMMLIIVGIITACSSGDSQPPISGNSQVQNQEEKPAAEPTQAELDQKLKSEAIKADFVTINGHTDENRDLKVFAEGKISVVDYQKVMDSFPSFLLSQKEDDGYGIYHISNMLSFPNLKDGDNVIVYGVLDGVDKSGIPRIIATIIEVK